MLKTHAGDELWLISQPDHAAVSGLLAAHWGNAGNGFARPGHFGDAVDPDAVRELVVLASAEHDNGWWEWEADPDIDPADSLPLHLSDLAGAGPQRGFDRWRLGIPRLAGNRPYVALLISYHAYWLYAYACEEGLDPSFHHPLFGKPDGGPSMVGIDLGRTREFLSELRDMQARLSERLRARPESAAMIAPAALSPNVRLVQLFDGLSLSLCFGAGKSVRMPGIPRASWEDRVDLELAPVGGRRIRVTPYPFDVDPLSVELRARVLAAKDNRDARVRREHFHTWWHGQPHTNIRFEYSSG